MRIPTLNNLKILYIDFMYYYLYIEFVLTLFCTAILYLFLKYYFMKF